MRRIASSVLVLSSLALAQTVNVGPGGAVQITDANGKKVKVGAGAVDVKSSSGAVSVKPGGAVDAQGQHGAVSGSGASPGAAATVGASGDADEAGDPLNLLDNGKTVEHTCAAEEAVNVSGNANTLTLHGPCETINVNGNGNTVRADVAGTINAMGNQNSVTWKSALTGKKPQVNALGSGNKVSQAR